MCVNLNQRFRVESTTIIMCVSDIYMYTVVLLL